MLRFLKTVLGVQGLVGLSMLAGCADLQDTMDEIAGSQNDNDKPRTVAFDCDDDREFRARFSGDREEARVDIGDREYDLEFTGRDDGMRVYRDEDDEVRLSVSNDEAHLSIADESDFENCERT